MDTPPGRTPAVDESLTSFLGSFQRLAEIAAEQSQRERTAGGEPLVPVLQAHLGTDPRTLPVLTEQLSILRAVDADVALEHVIAGYGGGGLIGIGGGEQRWNSSLSEIVQHAGQYGRFPVGPVDYRTVPVGPDTERSAISFGLHLFHVARDGASQPVAVLERGGNPQFGQQPQLEVLAAADGVAAALLSEVREAMNTFSVLRGQVVTFTASDYEPSAGGVTFQRRPELGVADVVLPDGTLERIERHVLGIARHREDLSRAGQHLKRGVLLYGPPGTGKTHTVRYLVGAAEDATVILLSGLSLQLVSLAASTARVLQPAIVVLEDCDLVAEERGHMSSSPLLFEVLDALDGLAADSDVVFLLTTNRVDVLEPALAQRPGRVDLAVEIPLPDTLARRALIGLYARDLPFSAVGLDEVAAGAEGTTASFSKELVRRAVLLAAEAGDAGEVGDPELRAALEEMMADSDAITRALLGGSGDEGEPVIAEHEGHPSGAGWFAYAPRSGSGFSPRFRPRFRG